MNEDSQIVVKFNLSDYLQKLNKCVSISLLKIELWLASTLLVDKLFESVIFL